MIHSPLVIIRSLPDPIFTCAPSQPGAQSKSSDTQRVRLVNAQNVCSRELVTAVRGARSWPACETTVGGISVRSPQSSPNAYLVCEAEGVASARLVIDAAGLPAHFEFDQAPRHRRSPHPHRVAATGCRAAPGTIFCSAQTVLSFQVLPRFDTTQTVRAPRGPTTSGLLSAPVRTTFSDRRRI